MIYRIHFNSEAYKQFDLSELDLFDSVERYMDWDEFEVITTKGGSFDGKWSDCSATWMDSISDENITPDIAVWDRSRWLVLSEKAYEALNGILTPYGEFLPITIDGTPWHVFNCLNVVDVDHCRSKASFESGVYFDVSEIHFKEGVESDQLVFTTDYTQRGIMYCSDTFKTLIESTELTGLTFNKDLTSFES
ncbi:hypothetical protein [Agaribacterium sp. ZY112]|uniref:hypothetical protein n=1 Tax=Agaribacterium sp. ZY112 TaxID=3233574 RepID=UPI0035267B01